MLKRLKSAILYAKSDISVRQRRFKYQTYELINTPKRSPPVAWFASVLLALAHTRRIRSCRLGTHAWDSSSGLNATSEPHATQSNHEHDRIKRAGETTQHPLGSVPTARSRDRRELRTTSPSRCKQTNAWMRAGWRFLVANRFSSKNKTTTESILNASRRYVLKSSERR